jgi:hypothetical protein
MNPANVPSIPKLTTGQLFLGPRGRNVIQVEDSKTFILTILHVKNIVYTSLDGIHFVNTADGSDTASVVTSGPVGPMGQKVNGQAIVIHRPDGNRFFYSSKHPPLLLKGDIFLSDSQVMIEVLSSNEFTLKTDSTSDVLRKYSSVNGHRFKESRQRNPNDTDEISKAYVVAHGPISAVGDNMLGQGIKLREDGKDIYFYYSRNISESTDNNNINLLTPTPTAATSTSVDIPASVETPTVTTTTTPGWTLVFSHRVNAVSNDQYFANSNEVMSANGDPSATVHKFSILNQLEKYRSNGSFHFKLVYPEISQPNFIEWTQTSNPTTDSDVKNPTAISTVPWATGTAPGNWGGGLRLSDNKATFIKGDGAATFWYYAIGTTTPWGGANIPGPVSIPSQHWVQLYVLPSNTTSSSGSKSGFTTIQEDIPSVYINQYKVYPTLKNKKQQKNGYQPIQEYLPYSEYSTSTNLFPF